MSNALFDENGHNQKRRMDVTAWLALALGACLVLAAGILAAWPLLTGDNPSNNGGVLATDNPTAMLNDRTPTRTPGQPSSTPHPGTPLPDAEAAFANRTPKPASPTPAPASPAEDAVLQGMQMPASGAIGMTYAAESLVYSKTLKQWQTHPGLDIICAEGTAVKAALEGVVESIENHPLLGVVVTLAHGTSGKTRYACLQEQPAVKQGDRVQPGDTLGQVGNTGIGEVEEGCHLHFEVELNGNPKNPADYLPEGSETGQ